MAQKATFAWQVSKFNLCALAPSYKQFKPINRSTEREAPSFDLAQQLRSNINNLWPELQTLPSNKNRISLTVTTWYSIDLRLKANWSGPNDKLSYRSTDWNRCRKTTYFFSHFYVQCRSWCLCRLVDCSDACAKASSSGSIVKCFGVLKSTKKCK